MISKTQGSHLTVHLLVVLYRCFQAAVLQEPIQRPRNLGPGLQNSSNTIQ